MNELTSVWQVAGMTCGHCALSVREEVEEIDGVTAVTVDHEGGRVEVVGERPVSREEMLAAVKEAGYRLEG